MPVINLTSLTIRLADEDGTVYKTMEPAAEPVKLQAEGDGCGREGAGRDGYRPAMKLFDRVAPDVLSRIALFGFVLNTLWEFGHAGPLYGMWAEVSLGEGLFYITLAILGDVVLVLGVAFLACCTAGWSHVIPPDTKGWFALLAFGFIAGVALEWIALALDWWTYNERMPTVTVFGEPVGLSPLVQVTLLPALSVFLGTRHTRFQPHSTDHDDDPRRSRRPSRRE
jgi:hypothetical protein